MAGGLRLCFYPDRREYQTGRPDGGQFAEIEWCRQSACRDADQMGAEVTGKRGWRDGNPAHYGSVAPMQGLIARPGRSHCIHRYGKHREAPDDQRARRQVIHG